MKSKRQTIWLVSMLSLMVILSAYYLFTEDGPQTSTPTDGQQVSTTNNGMSGNAAGDDVILSEVTSEGSENSSVITDDTAAADQTEQAADNEGNATPDAAQSDDAATSGEAQSTDSGKAAEGTPATGDGQKQAATDEDVLSQLESQGVTSTDTLNAYQFTRTQENMKKQEELMQAISENESLEASAMAQQELSALEEKEAKIYDIEERLKQQYANAVVTEADDKYKVVVVSEKMEAKEAVSIMDLVIKELGVSQDKVSVQYVTQ
ncbi:SpoIIIAH-like family protein [Paenibacillus timonensis]|uniref:SpoIIIAH-like family protein n=1 Tax=Paenibacillus timonensis TaxID=225915 RepID=A0ABW3S4Z9_9BACL|nr:SpoIIIAH-like family protein [Paenibacillus timonensis]MCH1639435.1 SpoIIIAH-like family protein [Paenibacillus timonensis]